MKKGTIVLLFSCLSVFCKAQLIYSDLYSSQSIGNLSTILISGDEKLGQIKHLPNGDWELTSLQTGSLKLAQALTEEWVDDATTAAKVIIGYVGVQNQPCHHYLVRKIQNRFQIEIFRCN
ncbi:MAG: hypothetical protein IPM48_07060 [Saprospiraceae bacterium]|nr:hypothetical protein [Saprospiraceae bacterium]